MTTFFGWANWVKVFKNEPSKNCGRQPLKIWSDTVCLSRFSSAWFTRDIYFFPQDMKFRVAQVSPQVWKITFTFWLGLIIVLLAGFTISRVLLIIAFFILFCIFRIRQWKERKRHSMSANFILVISQGGSLEDI